jgi:hypothetical protein
MKNSKGASLYITVLVEQTRKRFFFFSLRLKNADNDKQIKYAFLNEPHALIYTNVHWFFLNKIISRSSVKFYQRNSRTRLHFTSS